MLVIGKSANGKGVIAKTDIKKDQLIWKFGGRIVRNPTKRTLQIDENRHLEGDISDYMNHSCNPNAYVDFNGLVLRAHRNIRKGEEITFNYLTTEWDMSNKFQCHCGSEKCYGEIKGFRYLSLEQKKELEPELSPFLKKKLQALSEG